MDISTKRYHDIRSKALKCKKLFRTSNPVAIARGLGINYSVLPLNSIEGFATEDQHGHCSIFISDKYNSYQRRILCAHELGHIILHSEDELNCFDRDEGPTSPVITEYEADLFAIELMPFIAARIDYTALNAQELHQYIKSLLY